MDEYSALVCIEHFVLTGQDLFCFVSACGKCCHTLCSPYILNSQCNRDRAAAASRSEQYVTEQPMVSAFQPQQALHVLICAYDLHWRDVKNPAFN